MNRDYFINPHQSRFDARAFGKTGPVLPMEQPGLWSRLLRWVGEKAS